MRLHQALLSCCTQLCHTSAPCWISGSFVALGSPSSDLLGFLWCSPSLPALLPAAPGAVGVNHGKSSPAWKIPPPRLNWGFNTHPGSAHTDFASKSPCLLCLFGHLSPLFHFPSCLCLATVSRCLPNIPQYSEKSMSRDPKFLLALRVGRGVLGSPSHKARSKSLSKCHGNPPGIEPLICSSSERSLATRLGLLHKAHIGKGSLLLPIPFQEALPRFIPFPNAKIPKVTQK